MILSICMSGKNAVGDSFKNIMNEMPDKPNMICVIPEGYSQKEFSTGFAQMISDDISHAKWRLIKAILLAYKLRCLVKAKGIKKVFIYFDNHWFNIILSLFLWNLNLDISVWVHDPKLHLGSNWKDKFIRWINAKFWFSNINQFIVAYNGALEDLSKDYGIEQRKLRVIYLPRMKEMEFEDIKDIDIIPEYDFIFFGRIEEYKGLDILIEVVKKMPEIKLLIVGGGNYVPTITKQMAECQNILFINRYVSDRELAMYIKKSKWVVLPYKTATGSQTVQIANYYDTPVIATRTGCFCEYIQEKVNGILVERYDCTLLENAMNLAMKENVLHYRDYMKKWLEEKFSLDNVVKHLSEILEIGNEPEKKIKILYIISTLSSCGPVNVLYNIIKYMDLNIFQVYILTLSSAKKNDRTGDFTSLGVRVVNLNLSRIRMVLLGGKYLKNALKKIYPDIVHAQCFRSSIYTAKYAGQHTTCVTIHNYPHKDFCFSYGKLMGKLMSAKYFGSINVLNERIACSKSIAEEINKKYGIVSNYIRNGIVIEKNLSQDINELMNIKKRLGLPLNKRIFISVGALSEGKNPEFIIKNFKKSVCYKETIIVFLGDGERRLVCESLKTENIIFKGNVNNVREYLRVAELFISASLTEGLPNSVLEALAEGVPVLLSDIEPHEEIYKLNPKIGRLFNVNNDNDFLCNLDMISSEINEQMQVNAKCIVDDYFKAQDMSEKYQMLYKNLLRDPSRREK